MKCPNCNEELKVYGDPQIQVAPVTDKEKDSKFPIKLVCSVSTIYSCPKCPTKASYTEQKEYEPFEPCDCDACPKVNEGIQPPSEGE